MSGGHYQYMYQTIQNVYEGELESYTLELMLSDFCGLLKSLEWYKSGDTSRKDYQEDVKKFINKWLKSDKGSEPKRVSDTIVKVDETLRRIESLLDDIKQ